MASNPGRNALRRSTVSPYARQTYMHSGHKRKRAGDTRGTLPVERCPGKAATVDRIEEQPSTQCGHATAGRARRSQCMPCVIKTISGRSPGDVRRYHTIGNVGLGTGTRISGRRSRRQQGVRSSRGAAAISRTASKGAWKITPTTMIRLGRPSSESVPRSASRRQRGGARPSRPSLVWWRERAVEGFHRLRVKEHR